MEFWRIVQVLSLPFYFWAGWLLLKQLLEDKENPIAPNVFPWVIGGSVFVFLYYLVWQFYNDPLAAAALNLLMVPFLKGYERLHAVWNAFPAVQRYLESKKPPAPAVFQNLDAVVLDKLERAQFDGGRIVPTDLKDKIRRVVRELVKQDFGADWNSDLFRKYPQSAEVAHAHYEEAFIKSFPYFLNLYLLGKECRDGIFLVPLWDSWSTGYTVRWMLHYTAWNSHHGCFETLKKTALDNYWGVTRSFLSEKEMASGKRILPDSYPGDFRDIPRKYLANTPYLTLFEGFENETRLINPLQPGNRLEHMFVLAPSGSGKTQLLQSIIVQDLELVRRGEATLVIIDSQGNKSQDPKKRRLIENLINLRTFATDLKDRFTYVRPSANMAFNLFDLGQNNLNLSPEQRQSRRDAAQSIILTSIPVGSDLQFRMLSRCVELAMLASVPTHNLLLRILTTPKETFSKAFGGLLKTAHPDTQLYFQTFFDGANTSVKQAVTSRVQSLTDNKTFREMLGKPTNDFYLFDEIEEGKAIVIDADVGLLGEHGTETFGRFLLAQLLFAGRQRQTNKPVYIYMDECHDFVRNDDNIATILQQARKQDIGLTFATTELFMINSQKVRESLQRVGILVDREKGTPPFTFNVHLRSNKDPIVAKIIPGMMEDLPRMTNEQYAEVHKPKQPPPQEAPIVRSRGATVTDVEVVDDDEEPGVVR